MYFFEDLISDAERNVSDDTYIDRFEVRHALPLVHQTDCHTSACAESFRGNIRRLWCAHDRYDIFSEYLSQIS